MLTRQLALLATAFLVMSPASARAQPVTLQNPVFPPLDIEGTGLCAASAESTSVANDFGFLNDGNYNGNLNTFMEAHKADRVEGVIRTLLDLSNNNDTGLRLSYGDFTGQMSPTCRFGGCDFVGWNDASTAFASRLRGYFNVTSDLAGQEIHFGFYVDDAVSLTFFDRDAIAYPVLIRPPQLGAPTWRVTNAVTFQNPGLYPVEILYVEVTEHAALEMSYFIGPFEDYELAANSPGSTSLRTAGFTIFPVTSFFQTLRGAPSFPDLTQCQQCDRQFSNLPGNSGCSLGYYCNDAALCAPCNTNAFCGEECSRCGADTPLCIERDGVRECGQCERDSDCDEGLTCDLTTNTCRECDEDSDCPRANICVEGTCVPCETNERCGGNSCNCCPVGSNGKPMQCAPIEPNGPAVCVECISNADCPSGVCDAPSGHCVAERSQTDYSSTACGDEDVTCPNDYPHCIPGPVGTACAQCRHDLDCPDGNLCVSGECKACTRDRRCGPRCDSCAGDTPFCTGRFADEARCVRCKSDDQCAGGTCNQETHECEPGCMATCAAETPYCDGEKCVECYADTQCPCGNTCDLSTNTCDTSCKANIDCLGNQHCRWTEAADAKECALGPMPEDAACGGTLATICSVSPGRKGEDPPSIGALALAMLALLGRRRSGGKP